MKVYCKSCGIECHINTFLTFFDDCYEFKEHGFIGNYYCNECAEIKQNKILKELRGK